MQPSARVREPVVAGQFYPAQAADLSSAIDDLLAAAPGLPIPNVMALVAPHAGYSFSGLTAARGYRQIAGRELETVVIMAPSHRFSFVGASVLDVDSYRTPLGLVAISPLAEKLRKLPLFDCVPEAHRAEHSLEVQLPFLQRVVTAFSLVPIIFGSVDARAVAKAIVPYLGPKTLVVASSDLSHFHRYAEAQQLDRACVDAICTLDASAVREAEACGKGPVEALIHIARMQGWQTELLDYRNSGDTAGSKERVVGYASVAFFGGG